MLKKAIRLKKTGKKARVAPETKEPANLSEHQVEYPKDRVQELLLDDIKNFQSFDLNKEGKIVGRMNWDEIEKVIKQIQLLA